MFNRYFLSPDGAPRPASLRCVHPRDDPGRRRTQDEQVPRQRRGLARHHRVPRPDALRFTLANMATNTQDVRMPVERDETTGKNTSPKFDSAHCHRLFNATKFRADEHRRSDRHLHRPGQQARCPPPTSGCSAACVQHDRPLRGRAGATTPSASTLRPYDILSAITATGTSKP